MDHQEQSLYEQSGNRPQHSASPASEAPLTIVAVHNRFEQPAGCMSLVLVWSIVAFCTGIENLVKHNIFPPPFFSAFLGLHLDQSNITGIPVSPIFSTVLDTMLINLWVGVVALCCWGMWKHKCWALWGARIIISFILLRLWIVSIILLFPSIAHPLRSWLWDLIYLTLLLALSLNWLLCLCHRAIRIHLPSILQCHSG